MNFESVMPIVEAVLYEGYILYPYRPSARKNRQRWTFGGIYPRSYFEASAGADPCHMHAECLLEGGRDTRIDVRLRFLQPTARRIGKLARARASWPAEREPEFELVPELTVGGRPWYAWQEAREREVPVAAGRLHEWLRDDMVRDFRFAAEREIRPLEDEAGFIQGVLIHEGMTIEGRIRFTIEPVNEGLWRLAVHVENHTPMDPASAKSRDEASLYSFASTHVLFGTEGGAFVSLADPPPAHAEAASACHNEGVWPTMAGEPGSHERMLASPITLDDYPEIAPESPGNLYDATEIDELLSLEVLAMSEAEKREMAAADPRGAALLARVEALGGEDFMRLHGMLRTPRTGDAGPSPLHPESFGQQARKSESNGAPLACHRDGASELKVGDAVRLRPRAGGDVMDLALAGKTAIIEAIEHDFDERTHVAVCLDDDPGREWGFDRMPGHRFFFSPEEIEPLGAEARAR